MTKIFIAGNFLSKTTNVRGICEEQAEYFRAIGWEVYSASGYKNRILRMVDFLWTAWFYRNNYKLVLVEVYSFFAFWWAELLCFFLRLLHKNYVLSLHGGKLVEFALANPKRFRKLILSADRVTTPSKFLLHQFSKIRNDIIWLPNGIYLSFYEFKRRKKVMPKLIWLRALHEIYAPTMAVEVLHILREKFPDMTLTVVGPDKGDGSLEKVQDLAIQYHLERQVNIIGGVPKKKVPHWLNQGDIFLNTTRIESFGVSVLEAAACGLPIVTTDAGELPYMWEDGADALVVPVDDPIAMAEAVARILTTPELTQKLSINARKKAENYDWSRIMPQWEALFESLISDE